MFNSSDEFRTMYPHVIYWSEAQFGQAKKASIANNCDGEDITPETVESYYNGLAKDAKRIRDGIPMVTWPEAGTKMLDHIKQYTVEICTIKMAQISRISEAQNRLNEILKAMNISRDTWFTDVVQQAEINGITIRQDEFHYLPIAMPNWEDQFLNVPVLRLSIASQWQKPFDAASNELSEFNFSILINYLDQTHERIGRGHNWASVGEWSIANRNYLNALSLAIATNNIDAVEAVTRFLVDIYVASRKCSSAINLVNDFLHSQAYRKTPQNYMTRQMLESIAFGLVMEHRTSEAQSWLRKIPNLCETTSDDDVSEWYISSLLADVYKYQKNRISYFELRSAIDCVSKLLAT